MKQLDNVVEEFFVVERAMADVGPVPHVGQCKMSLEMIVVRIRKTIRHRDDDTWTEIYAIISGVTSFIPWSSAFDERAAVRCPVKADDGPV